MGVTRLTADAPLEAMFAEVMDEVTSGKRKVSKALLLLLDDSDGQYHVGFRNYNAKMSELIAMARVFEAIALQMMGHMEGPYNDQPGR